MDQVLNNRPEESQNEREELPMIVVNNWDENSERPSRASGYIDEIDFGHAREEITLPNVENRFATKRMMAQGMMDVALITANGNQLAFVYRHRDEVYFSIAVCLIISSMIMQLLVGFTMIWLSSRNVAEEDNQNLEKRYIIADKIVLSLVFFITILNILIASFANV